MVVLTRRVGEALRLEVPEGPVELASLTVLSVLGDVVLLGVETPDASVVLQPAPERDLTRQGPTRLS